MLVSTSAGDSGGGLELTLLSLPLRAALVVACSRRIALASDLPPPFDCNTIATFSLCVIGGYCI
jgi:hypothetical protein